MVCKSGAKMTQMRHDMVASAVRRVICRAGCASSMEPSYRLWFRKLSGAQLQAQHSLQQLLLLQPATTEQTNAPVSYTHLTLPTILLV